MPSTRLYGPSIATPLPATPLAINVQAGSGIVPLPATLTANTVTTEQMILNPAQPTLPLLVQIPSKSGIAQKRFNLQTSGYIKTLGTTNITLKLYSGTSATPGSNTLLASSGAIAQNSASAPYWINGDFVYDSISGKLTGTVGFLVNNTVVASVAVSNVITGINAVNNPVASFGVSATFSAGFTGNAITVAEHCIAF